MDWRGRRSLPHFWRSRDIPQGHCCRRSSPEPEVFITDIDADTGEFSQHFENRTPRTTAEFVKQSSPCQQRSLKAANSNIILNSVWVGTIHRVGWFILAGYDQHRFKAYGISKHLISAESTRITPALISLEFIHAPFTEWSSNYGRANYCRNRHRNK